MRKTRSAASDSLPPLPPAIWRPSAKSFFQWISAGLVVWAIVLGLALKLAEVVEKRAVIEACLLASILINCAAVAVIAGLVLHH